MRILMLAVLSLALASPTSAQLLPSAPNNDGPMTFHITSSQQDQGYPYPGVEVRVSDVRPTARCAEFFDGQAPGYQHEVDPMTRKARNGWIKFFEPHPVGTAIRCEKVQALAGRGRCEIFSLGACTALP